MKKRIIITGVTHGIGKETAVKFLQEGWEVFGCASSRQERRGEEMMEQYRNFHFRRADVSDSREVEQLFEWCGPVSAAFNNAGTGCEPKAPHEMDEQAARRILEVNLLGTALCMKQECARMRESGGVVINNASVSALKAGTGADAVYSASKAGVLRLTAEAAVQKAYRGKIWFFSLVPGWIETRMTAMDRKEAWSQRLPAGRPGLPRQAAELVYAAVANPEPFESGQEFYISGGGHLL